ncbi:MAG: N-acetyltransferase [Candidatus Adlerbacteria bacterium]|nr:N-acetyltransferase [Candidatus Adlerbacteria bacterium]
MSQKVAYSLRSAECNDLQFLFKVSMGLSQEEKDFDRTTALAQYKEKFEPSKIQVIQYQGQDVGRLRVEKSSTSLYVGGIHLLPEFQGLGIGSSIFANLIEESKRAKVPITLEVFDVNSAFKFYSKLGFVQTGYNKEKRYKTLVYYPDYTSSTRQ